MNGLWSSQDNLNEAKSHSYSSDEIESYPLFCQEKVTTDVVTPNSSQQCGQNIHAPISNSGIPRNNSCFELTALRKFAIGCGHFQNDICAAMWFTYTLLYFEKVVPLSTDEEGNNYAGLLMLIGQLADGVATLLVGYEIDHSIIRPVNYGRCKSWHLWGTIIITISFPFIFSPVIGGSTETSAWAKFIYYIPFVAIFQIGWAIVQISHMAIIPKMHPDNIARTELFSIRFGFTVASTICIYLVTFVRLHIQEGESSNTKCELDQSGAGAFMMIAYFAVAVGLVFTVVFHIEVHEESDAEIKEKAALFNSYRENQIHRQIDTVRKCHSDEAEANEHLLHQYLVKNVSTPLEGSQKSAVSQLSKYDTSSIGERQKEMQVWDWIKLPSIYIITIIFMSSRLGMNLGQVFMPFFVQDMLQIDCTNLALVPMTTCVTACVLSFKTIETLNKLVGRQISYAIGAGFGCIGAILILILNWNDTLAQAWKTYCVYAIAIFLGVNISICMVTSQALSADVIGNNIESGAFVYSTLCVADKVTSGVVILLLNSFVPCSSDEDICENGSNGDYYQDVLAYSVGGTSLLGVIGVVSLTLYILRQHPIVRSRRESRH